MKEQLAEPSRAVGLLLIAEVDRRAPERVHSVDVGVVSRSVRETSGGRRRFADETARPGTTPASHPRPRASRLEPAAHVSPIQRVTSERMNLVTLVLNIENESDQIGRLRHRVTRWRRSGLHPARRADLDHFRANSRDVAAAGLVDDPRMEQ